MPRESVEVQPEAMAEAEGAAGCCRVQSKAAAGAFASKIDDAVKGIEEARDSWWQYILEARRLSAFDFHFLLCTRSKVQPSRSAPCLIVADPPPVT